MESNKGIKVGALYEVYDSTTLNKSLSHIEYNLVWLFFFFFFFLSLSLMKLTDVATSNWCTQITFYATSPPKMLPYTQRDIHSERKRKSVLKQINISIILISITLAPFSPN
jgi:hypothetical protein